MAKGRRFTSLDAATATGAGSSTKTRGHDELGFFVEANNLDDTNDTVDITLEVSADDNHFTTVDIGTTGETDVFSLTVSDFEQSDSDNSIWTAYIAGHNVPVEYVRANLTSYTDDSGSDLEITAYIFTGGWTGRGKSYNESENVPSNV